MSIQFTETVGININSTHGGNVLYANNHRSNPGKLIKKKMPWLGVLCKMCDVRVCIVLTVVPPQSWGDRSDTKHSKCLLLGGRRLNQLTLIPKPKGSGGARAATAQVGPANKRNDTKRCLPVEASLRPGEAVPW